MNFNQVKLAQILDMHCRSKGGTLFIAFVEPSKHKLDNLRNKIFVCIYLLFLCNTAYKQIVCFDLKKIVHYLKHSKYFGIMVNRTAAVY